METSRQEENIFGAVLLCHVKILLFQRAWAISGGKF